VGFEKLGLDRQFVVVFEVFVKGFAFVRAIFEGGLY